MKYQMGQNASEYALVIGLVVIVAIGALSTLGQQTSDLLGNTIGPKKGPPIQRFALSATPLPNVPNLVITGQNGKQYVIEGYPSSASSMKNLIDLSGTDGVNQLAQLIKTLSEVDDPTLLSKEEQDYLKLLANQGFDIVKKQKQLQDNFLISGQLDVDGNGSSTAFDAITFINSSNGLGGVIESKIKNNQIKQLVNHALNQIRASASSTATMVIHSLDTKTQNPDGTYGQKNPTIDGFNAMWSNNISTSFEGSDTICSNSQTGKTDHQQIQCVSKT